MRRIRRDCASYFVLLFVALAFPKPAKGQYDPSACIEVYRQAVANTLKVQERDHLIEELRDSYCSSSKRESAVNIHLAEAASRSGVVSNSAKDLGWERRANDAVCKNFEQSVNWEHARDIAAYIVNDRALELFNECVRGGGGLKIYINAQESIGLNQAFPINILWRKVSPNDPNELVVTGVGGDVAVCRGAKGKRIREIQLNTIQCRRNSAARGEMTIETDKAGSKSVILTELRTPSLRGCPEDAVCRQGAIAYLRRNFSLLGLSNNSRREILDKTGFRPGQLVNAIAYSHVDQGSTYAWQAVGLWLNDSQFDSKEKSHNGGQCAPTACDFELGGPIRTSSPAGSLRLEYGVIYTTDMTCGHPAANVVGTVEVCDPDLYRCR